ncbi:uncharacterized protein LOC126682530 [Mercurialis annua]|uniref:uncharacterized protein LOC126682530 n=1 Tax=Mercurialis annua TaxID=3986 RepID=UPI00215F58B5|nr:uncharacterized protein LOC126682530 [Mercurialis annua]
MFVFHSLMGFEHYSYENQKSKFATKVDLEAYYYRCCCSASISFVARYSIGIWRSFKSGLSIYLSSVIFGWVNRLGFVLCWFWSPAVFLALPDRMTSAGRTSLCILW